MGNYKRPHKKNLIIEEDWNGPCELRCGTPMIFKELSLFCDCTGLLKRVSGRRIRRVFTVDRQRLKGRGWLVKRGKW